MTRTETTTAAPLVPARRTLPALKRAAAGCCACDLCHTGTQTVFGEGARDASVVLVGEQPGDEEDRAGRPFVGPSGRLLDRCLVDAGIERAGAYVTNVVKHFKWVQKGKRRLHQKPNAREVKACRPWLDAELDLLRPKVVVLLGATAAQALLGRSFRVSQSRGRSVPSPLAPHVIATVHPSAVLRARGAEERAAARDAFVADLDVVAKLLR